MFSLDLTDEIEINYDRNERRLKMNFSKAKGTYDVLPKESARWAKC